MWIALLCTSFFHGLHAQMGYRVDSLDLEPYHVTQYQIESGLLQNTVKDLIIDKNGFLWIISEKGLSRFNGTGFKHFQGKPLSWSRGRLDRLYMRGDTIFPMGKSLFYLWDSQLKGPLQSNLFRKNLREFAGPRLWRKSPKLFNDTTATTVPYQEIVHLDDRHFYLIWDNEMQYFEDGVAVDTLKDAWVSDFDDYFSLEGSLFALKEKRLIQFEGARLANEFVLDILSDKARPIRNNNTESIFIYDPPNGNIYQLEFREKVPKLIPVMQWSRNMNATCVVQFGQDLFIGTRTLGLFHFQKKQFVNAYSKEHGHLNNTRSGVLLGRDSLLLATNVLVTPTRSYPDFLKELYAVYSVKDLDGNYWFKSDGHLFRVERGKITLRLEIPRKWLGNLQIDEEGTLWALVSNGFLRIQNDEVEEVLFDTAMFHHDDQVYYNPTSKDFHFSNGWSYDPEANELQPDPLLKGEEILFQYFTENMSWLRLSDKGMYMHRDGKLVAFPKDPADYIRYAHCILEDGNGYFWISTDYGLFQVLKQDLLDYFEDPSTPVYYHYYDKSYGFRNNEFNSKGNPCGFELPDGQFAFPSFEGLVLFDPEKVAAQPHGDGITIDRITIDGKDSALSENAVLEQNYKELHFDVAHSFFGHSNNLYMQYKLEGYHANWQPIGPNSPIQFSSLPHGNYTIRVRKLTGFGGRTAESSLAFIVSKRYHETIWFKTVMVISALFLITLAFAIRGLISKRRRIALEKVIEDKTHEYRMLNERLKLNVAQLRESQSQQKKTIKVKDRMMAIYTHDIRGPLRFIAMMAEKSRKILSTMPKEELDEYLKTIKDSSEGIYTQTEKMFSWSRLQSDDFILNMQELKLRPAIENTISSFAKQAREKNTKIQHRVPRDLTIFSEPNVLSIIINNIFQNAVKFTQRGVITIETYEIPGFDVISISDTGQGMSTRRLAQVLSGEFEPMKGTNQEEGKGFGIRVIRDFMSQMGGYLEIDSTEGSGTTVSLFFKRPSEPSVDQAE